MTPIAAKLAGPDIAPPRAVDGPHFAGRGGAGAPFDAPAVTSIGVVASIAIHGMIALALIALPMSTGLAPEIDTTWVSFDLAPIAPAPVIAPEPVVVPPPPVVPEPERIVRRERPQPVAEPEIAPQPEVHAPPSIDDVFAEPPPLAAVLAAEGTGAGPTFTQGELGGVPGGVPGGHGTSLVSTARPSPTPDTSSLEADRRRARRGYVHAIEELVRAHTRYPRAAGREGLQGRVELALRIANDGRVLAIRVASTSGHGILDEAAVDAAREIDRMPTPPLVAALTATDEVRVGVVYVVR